MEESMEIQKRDKVCDICGDVGYSKDIMTCCQCNQVSEHIYCVQKRPDSNQEDWRCEGCIESNQISFTKRKTGEIYSKLNRSRIPVQGSLLSSYQENSEQISVVDKQYTDTQKSLGTQDCSSELLDISNGTSCTRDTASGRHVKQPISFPKMVGNAKVKFIPDDELMTSRAKARASHKRQSSDLLLTPINQENTMRASVSRKTYNIVSLSASSKEVLLKQEGTTIAEVQPFFSRPTSENAVNDMEKNMQNYSASGKEAFGVLCKKEHLEVPSENDMRTESMNNYITPPLPNDEKRKRLMTKPLGHAVPIKEEPMEECTKATIYDSPSKNIVPMESKCTHATPFLTNGVVHNLGINKFMGNTINPDAQFSKAGYQKKGLPSALLIVSDDEHPDHPVEEPLWKGEFEISDSVTDVYEGIQAHIPAKVSLKAYNMLYQLPARIKFKLLRRIDVWPRAFHSYPPATNDIGLYFFPCELHRSKEKYIHLMEWIDQSDLAMQSCIGDVELLIFTSKQLSNDSQGLAMEMFLWGIFRRLKCKKGNLHGQKQFQTQTQYASMEDGCSRKNTKLECNSEVNMGEAVNHACRQTILSPESYPKFNMLPGTVIGRINRPNSGVNIPPGFSEPYTRNMDHEMRPYTHGRVTSSTISDSPPGFTKPYSWRTESTSVEGVAMGSRFSVKDTSCGIPPWSRAE